MASKKSAIEFGRSLMAGRNLVSGSCKRDGGVVLEQNWLRGEKRERRGATSECGQERSRGSSAQAGMTKLRQRLVSPDLVNASWHDTSKVVTCVIRPTGYKLDYTSNAVTGVIRHAK